MPRETSEAHAWRATEIIEADGPAGVLYVAVDPAARFVAPAVGSMGFAATLTPYSSIEAACEGLVAAGGTVRP